MAHTQATQIKVTLPDELYMLIKTKADRFGLNLATYMRHLAITDSKEDFPTYPMSTRTEKLGLKALKDYKAGRTIKVTDIDKYFESL